MTLARRDEHPREIHAANGALTSKTAVVGGLVTVVSLENGVELWCNDEGRIRGLPLNLVIPTTAPQIPAGFEDAFVIRLGDDLALPGEPREWRIYGDFFLARTHVDGELADVTDEDVVHYQRQWA